MNAYAPDAGLSGHVAVLLRWAGSRLLVAANRVEQRSPLTLALEPLAPAAPVPDPDELRARISLPRYY